MSQKCLCMSLSLIVIVLFYLQVQGLHPTKISLNTDLTHEPRLQRSWKQSRQETVNLVDKTIDPRHKQLTVGGAWWPLVCLLGVELLWKSECEWFYIGTMFCFVFFGYHVPHSSFFVFLAHVLSFFVSPGWVQWSWCVMCSALPAAEVFFRNICRNS